MNKKQFFGIYALHINNFIALKRGLGFKYNTEETIYSIFDRFTIQRGEKIVGITQDLATEWCKRNKNESDSYRQHRAICLSQLSSYLCQVGVRSVSVPISLRYQLCTPLSLRTFFLKMKCWHFLTQLISYEQKGGV